MKIKVDTLLILLLPLTFSCRNNTNQNSTPEKLIEKAPSIDTVRIYSTEIKQLDSSKLIKAFDNISFGLPEQKPIYNESGYAINGIPFEISNKKYSNDFGLYYFQLAASRIKDFDHTNETLGDIIEIIKIKYGNPTKINIVFPDDLKVFLNKGPKDDGSLIYKYQWIKNGIKIKLGYEIGYRYEYEKVLAQSPSGGMVETDSKNASKSIKTISARLSFVYLPISEKIDKENENVEKNRIEKEAGKL